MSLAAQSLLALAANVIGTSGPLYQLLSHLAGESGSGDGSPPGDLLVAAAPVDFPYVDASSSTEIALSLTSPSLVDQVLVRVSEVLDPVDDLGSIEIRVGSTLGGDEILLDQTIDNTTPIDTTFGITLTEIGSDMDPLNGYQNKPPYPAGQILYVTMTRSGIVDHGAITVYVRGIALTLCRVAGLPRSIRSILRRFSREVWWTEICSRLHGYAGHL